MQTNEKKIIIIILVIGIILIVGICISRIGGKNTDKIQNNKLSNENEEKNVQVFEDGTKINKSSKLKEKKTVEGLEITESQLVYRNGTSKLIAKVTNTNKKDIGITPIEITLYDSQNKELEKIEGIISPIKAGESVELNIGISKDCADIYDFSIKIK